MPIKKTVKKVAKKAVKRTTKKVSKPATSVSGITDPGNPKDGICEKVRLICVDPLGNNNKFWHADIYTDGRVFAHWGRIGGKGDQGWTTKAKARSKIRTKQNRPKNKYVPQKTVEGSTPAYTSTVKNQDLHAIAKSQIKTGSPALFKLVDRLIAANIHKITSSTQIQYNANTGTFSTPLGIVTQEGILEARDLLFKITTAKNSSLRFYTLGGQYLQIIPQKVGQQVKKFLDENFTDQESIDKQNDILDSLEISLKTIAKAKPKTKKTNIPQESIFDLSLDILSEKKEIRRIEKWYKSTNKSMHGYQRVKIKNIYSVDIHPMTEAFEKNPIPDIKEYFHGTGMANCLSILKSGLKVAPPNTAPIAGKMFGNGVYGADCASKALGYSLGRWGQGSSRNTAWLFVCEFKMGETYKAPKCLNGPPKGYDSVKALAGFTKTWGNSTLFNNEFIIYKNEQVRLKYLIECENPD
jgi:predicted DNA-binding WGR domain protein